MAYNGPLPQVVAAGGTGDNNLTLNGVLLGQGTNSVEVISPGNTGTVFIGNTSAVPSWSATPSLTSVTATNIIGGTTSTAVSANASDFYTGVTDNTSARTITLLTADVGVAGTIKVIKDEAGTAASANNITIVGQGSETIDGAASIQITANYGCLRVVARNSKWWTF